MSFLTAAAAVLGLAMAAPVQASVDAEPTSYAPRNECREDPGAAAFLDALAAAVAARDSAWLVALAAEDVHLDFGGGEGRDELRARLDGTVEGYGDLWSELSTVLALGCDLDEPGFITLPWYFAQDFGDRDAFATMLVVQPAAKVRATPDYEAEAISSLHWDAVETTGDYDPEANFTEVLLPDRSRGYVETVALRSLIDYRLAAEKGDDGWKILAFIAGD